MIISENNIEKSLTYLEKLSDEKYETLIDNIVNEQAYLSTFIQQNLDNIFKENEDIKDFAFNIYANVLYFYKSKNSEKYNIVNDIILKNILDTKKFEHNQESIGDFIYSQIVNEKFSKDDSVEILNLIAIIINCLDYKL